MIQDDQNLNRLFHDEEIVQTNNYRAYVATMHDGVIYAASLFSVRSGSGPDRLGAMFCRAALLTPAKTENLKVVQEVVGDRWTAEAYMAGKDFGGNVRGLTYNVKSVSEDWYLAVCKAEKANVEISFITVTPSEVPAARYRAAKRLFAAGRRGEALGLFRHLRADPAIYQNAIPFIIAILAKDSDELARSIKASIMDIDRVTDRDAMIAYAAAMDQLGFPDEADLARVLLPALQ